MARSEWTQKLSRRQLEGIIRDVRERERSDPDQPQQHVHKDIAEELKHRDSLRK